MVDSGKCVFLLANYKFINVSTCAFVGASTLEDIKNLVWLMCFYWYFCRDIVVFCSCLLCDFTFNVTSTPKAMTIVDFVETIGCYIAL